MCGLEKLLYGDILCNTQLKTILGDSTKGAAKTNWKKAERLGGQPSKVQRLASVNSNSLTFHYCVTIFLVCTQRVYITYYAPQVEYIMWIKREGEREAKRSIRLVQK